MALRACPKPNSGEKKIFGKATPPKKSYFFVLFHVLTTVFAYLAPIIGKNLLKIVKNGSKAQNCTILLLKQLKAFLAEILADS